MTHHERIREWLHQFAACVRNRDLESGRKLFTEDSSGFGTRVREARNLTELVELQWDPTWAQTRDFRFIDESVSTLASDDGSQVVVTATWSSFGLTPQCAAFPRRGRSTIVLQKCDSNPHGYVARHTHFSKDPSGEL